MKIKYNAPATLSFSLVCTIVLILDMTLLPSLTETWFMVPPKGLFMANDFRSWILVVTHIIGHGDWSHLLGNLTIILLVGPMLEQIYGSLSLLFMIIVTALVTGILNVLLFSTALMGASGVVFMMILLASFTNFSKGEIPLTFILIVIIFLGRELVEAFSANNVSEFAHIVGGFCGSLFGFFKPAKR